MSKVSFVYNGEEFPCLIEREEGYEKLAVLIPEITGDYFLAVIDSCGTYEMKEEVSADDVTVITTGDRSIISNDTAPTAEEKGGRG